MECVCEFDPRGLPPSSKLINTMAPSTISVMYTYITLSGLNIYAGRSVWGNILCNSEEF